MLISLQAITPFLSRSNQAVMALAVGSPHKEFPMTDLLDYMTPEEAVTSLLAVQDQESRIREFAVTMARTLMDDMCDSRSRTAIVVADGYLHGEYSDEELAVANSMADKALKKLTQGLPTQAQLSAAWAAVLVTTKRAAVAAHVVSFLDAKTAEPELRKLFAA